MAFHVVHGSPQDIWAPMTYAATIYTGSIVEVDTTSASGNEGLVVKSVADGENDGDDDSVIVGVCIGNNLRHPLYSATYFHEYITSADPTDSTLEHVLTGGPFPTGSREDFVKISLVDPCTTINGPLFNGAWNTAPALLTAASGLSHIGATFNACQEYEQYHSTIYFRTGPNAGAYRILNNSDSTSVLAWDTPLYKDVVAGDTAVVVNTRNIGPGRIYTDATATWIDCDHDNTEDFLGVFAVQLDLEIAGSENLTFRFDGDHFTGKRT